MGRYTQQFIHRLFLTLVAVAMTGCGDVDDSANSNTLSIRLEVSDSGIYEGDSGNRQLQFTLRLNYPLDQGVSVDFATSDGSAVAGSDYTALSGTITFPAGVQYQTFSVPVTGDVTQEGNESFTVTFSNLSPGITLSANSVTGTLFDDDNPTFKALNDTGYTECGGEDSSGVLTNHLTCPQTTYPGQDGDYGLDVSASGSSDGRAGFQFIKRDSSGAALSDQQANYAVTPWDCVEDLVTGLFWEVKSNSGGLRDGSWDYSWYDGAFTLLEGDEGVRDGGSCASGGCDTEAYILSVNQQGLCGYFDWRLPRRDELRSLIDYSRIGSGVAIDSTFFPNSELDWYWSCCRSSEFSQGSWAVDFASGRAAARALSLVAHVRLVRGGQ